MLPVYSGKVYPDSNDHRERTTDLDEYQLTDSMSGKPFQSNYETELGSPNMRSNISKKNVAEIDMARDGKQEDPLKNFASTTTMHGVSFYYNSKSKPIKAFWIILLVGMGAMLTYQVVDRIVAYFDYETNTSIIQEFVVEMPFPAVTICTFNRFYMESQALPLIDAIHVFNQLITPTNVGRNGIRNHRPNLSEVADLLDSELNIRRLLRKHGFYLTGKVMPRCVFKYEDCSSEDFSEVLSWMGVCHTFNADNVSKIQNIPGAGNGLSVTLNVQLDGITEEPVFGLRDAGLRIQVHQRGETPDVGSLGMSIPVGRKASIEVTRQDFNLMYKPWGICDPSNENLKFFPVYTLNNCLQECYTNAVIDRCGCYIFTQYWAEEYGRQCTMSEMQDCASEYLIHVQRTHSADICNCTVPCSHSDYHSTISYATFPNPPTTGALAKIWEIPETEASQNVVEFDLYFKAMSYSKLTQSKKIDESSLLSDIGGQLGLWLGMSIITAVEIVQFCARKVCRCGKTKKS